MKPSPLNKWGNDRLKSVKKEEIGDGGEI